MKIDLGSGQNAIVTDRAFEALERRRSLAVLKAMSGPLKRFFILRWARQDAERLKLLQDFEGTVH